MRYGYGTKKGCIFQYSAIFAFSKGNETILHDLIKYQWPPTSIQYTSLHAIFSLRLYLAYLSLYLTSLSQLCFLSRLPTMEYSPVKSLLQP